jgi:hypothetical protein
MHTAIIHMLVGLFSIILMIAGFRFIDELLGVDKWFK